MSGLNRRKFIGLLGKGTAALGLGFSLSSGTSCAKEESGTTAGPETKEENVKYQTFYPGEYFDWEKDVVEERLEQVKKGSQGGGGMPGRGPSVITEEDILAYNNKMDPYNPLFNDREYAQKAGYPGVPAFPCFQQPGTGRVTGIPHNIADKFYFGNDGSNVQVWTHIFAGDSFTSEPEMNEFTELTVPGSDLRHFKLGGSGKMYNRKGEQVGWAYGNTRDAYKKIIDGSPKPTYTENMTEWLEYLPPAHYTTDEEWDYIQELWDKEYIRGSQKLYWEDVNVGDEPAWACSDGPITYMHMMHLHGGRAMTRNALRGDKDLFIYDPYGQRHATLSRHYGSMNFPGSRSMFFNSTGAIFIMRMLTNYIGDAGLVTKVHWHMMQTFKEVRIERPGGEYMDKVPEMKGRGCEVHGYEGDTVIAKGCVTDKYINERGEHTIDLTCWGETLDDRIVVVVGASAKLPSKKG